MKCQESSCDNDAIEPWVVCMDHNDSTTFARMISLFESFDRDGDGFITKQEFLDVTKQSWFKQNAGFRARFEAAEYAAADDETRTAIFDAQWEQSDAQWNQENYDRAEELWEMPATEAAPEQTWNRLYMEYDEDADGQINLQEFIRMWQRRAEIFGTEVPLPTQIWSEHPACATVEPVERSEHNSTGSAWQRAFPRAIWPPEFLELGCSIPDTAQRGMTIDQLNLAVGFFYTVLDGAVVVDESAFSPTYKQRVTWKALTMYTIFPHFVIPLTAVLRDCGSVGCSFVELLAPTVQKPRWFVSHFWGGQFALLVHMLNFHSKQHKLTGQNAVYWICTFANVKPHSTTHCVPDPLCAEST